MAEEETQTGEMELKGPGGLGLRTKGYRLMDIAWIVVGGGVIWNAWAQTSHAGDSDRQSTAIVKSINDANMAVVHSLKESNAATVQALRELAIEQKKSTAAIREIACLSDPSIRNQTNARDFCRRMSREDR